MALAPRSKTGCFNCRRRRIKCDETHPSCVRCQKTGIPCAWLGRRTITSAYVQTNTALGNTYASLFLQDENVDFESELPSRAPWSCPARYLSSGYPRFRSEEEHHNLVKLSGFLSMVTLDRSSINTREPGFEFTVATQELWVRDALLAFAGFVNGFRDRESIWKNVLPYYISATRTVQEYVAGPLDEARLEQLLIASQFLGMLEINNPQNEVFPLLHFEAVGRILEALHQLQAGKQLSPATKRFHRIALESYLYHVAIQSMYYPQTDQYPLLATSNEPIHDLFTTRKEAKIITKLDLNVYIMLFKLARLARGEILNADQQAQAEQLHMQLDQMEDTARAELEAISNPSEERKVSYLEMTLVGIAALKILCTKVSNRALLAKSPELRPLVDRLLRRLGPVRPSRQWTGDFVWTLTIGLCAVYSQTECKALTRKVEQLSSGFWGSDLKRIKAVLKLVRSKRTSVVKKTIESDDAGVAADDTLGLLVNSGLSMS